MISHHPSAEVQFNYSTRTLTEPFALAVASHVALCDRCSGHLEELKPGGGMMQKRVHSVEMTDQVMGSVIPDANLTDGQPMTEAQNPRRPDPRSDSRTSAPISFTQPRRYSLEGGDRGNRRIPA